MKIGRLVDEKEGNCQWMRKMGPISCTKIIITQRKKLHDDSWIERGWGSMDEKEGVGPWMRKMDRISSR